MARDGQHSPPETGTQACMGCPVTNSSISLPSSRISDAITEKYSRLVRHTASPGFRPGACMRDRPILSFSARASTGHDLRFPRNNTHNLQQPARQRSPDTERAWRRDAHRIALSKNGGHGSFPYSDGSREILPHARSQCPGDANQKQA